MKFALSRRLELPLIITRYGEYYAWDFATIVRHQLLARKLRRLGFAVSYGMLREWPLFKKWYLPPANVGKHDLILDVGARDGDTAIFFYLNGYDNLRLVEPGSVSLANLRLNVQALRGKGCKVDLLEEPFTPSQLEGAAFLKMDCEGCERAVNFAGLSIPYVVELHKPKAPVAGVYPYAEATGYLVSKPGGAK